MDCEDFRSSTESTISTLLIHNIASDGVPEQARTWVLNLFFQHENVDGVGNLSNEVPKLEALKSNHMIL